MLVVISFQKKEEEAFLLVGRCYQLTAGVGNGTGHYGISDEIITCNKEAREKIGFVLESWSHKLKNAGDKLVAVGKGLGSFFYKLPQGEVPELKIPQTNYEALESFNSRFIVEEKYFKHPEADGLTSQSIARFQDKLKNSLSSYGRVSQKYKNAENEIPNFLLVYNLIHTPNYKTQEIKMIKKYIENGLDTIDYYIHTEARYNSALELSDKINTNIDELIEINNKERNIKRSIDYLAISITLIILGLMLWFIIKKYKN